MVDGGCWYLLDRGLTCQSGLGLYEPVDGKVIFGAWVDSATAGTPNAFQTAGGDSPSLFNTRLGLNAGAFQLSQNLPVNISQYDHSKLTANLTLIEATKTGIYIVAISPYRTLTPIIESSDAILFLTVYPTSFVDGVYTDDDIASLAYQLSNITDPSLSSRRVMLRFAPEMNGYWFSYGLQPVKFVSEWKRIVTAVRAVTNRVAFVWSPNSGNLYPFGATKPSNATEAAALDTNNNGELDNGDDPYTPYWPGAEYVDWVGISLYWKGNIDTGTPPHDNSASPTDYWTQMVQGGPDGSNTAFPFYTMFADKYSIPLVMSEGGAAFALFQGPTNTTLPVNAGQITIEQTFWRSYLSTTVFSTYPKAKMFFNFEYAKYDEDATKDAQGNYIDDGVTRDYRITWDPSTLAAFKSDVASLSSTLQWAVNFVGGIDPLTIAGGQTPQSSTASISGTATAAATKSAAQSVGSSAFAIFFLLGLFF
ncbi:hypothetical protein HK100_011245 [Physocladia obscura]|uniref:GH26 domain-containing protein n=1 Tax=Physocladia obscura TaxID=109957 RepID=A0AAD5T7H2_9FUNG|nr:hypothetical protein HK100_011245 [Physocladia obscura]